MVYGSIVNRIEVKKNKGGEEAARAEGQSPAFDVAAREGSRRACPPRVMIYTHVIRGMDSTAESPLDEL